MRLPGIARHRSTFSEARLFAAGGALSAAAERISRWGFIVVPLAFYFLTACRTPGWIDATLIASNVYDLELNSWVNTHNLFNLVGWIWLRIVPGQNVHFELVLLSALFGAAAIQAIYLIGIELTANRTAAALGGAALTVSHSLWWHSTMLEVYTLNALCIALVLLFVLRFERTRLNRHLYPAVFFFGLGCSNHVLVGLFVFSFTWLLAFLIIKKRLTLKSTALLSLCFLLGFSIYLYAFFKDYAQARQKGYVTDSSRSGETESGSRKLLVDLLAKATGGEFRKYMFPRGMPAETRTFWRINYLVLCCVNFLSPALFLGIYGFWVFFRRRAYRMTFVFFLVGFIAQVVWSANYLIWDMYAFSMPVYLLFALPLILGLDAVIRRSRKARLAVLLLTPTLLFPAFFYTRLPAMAEGSAVLQRYFSYYREVRQVQDTWDAVRYVVNPSKRNYREVEEVCNRIFAILPEHAHYWTDDSRCDYPLRLYYRDIYGIRQDIRYHSVFGPFMNEEAAKEQAEKMLSLLQAGRDVYLASLGYPHRPVLDQLYCLLDSTAPLGRVQDMSESDLAAAFPTYRIESIRLFPGREIHRYHLVER